MRTYHWGALALIFIIAYMLGVYFPNTGNMVRTKLMGA